MQVTSSSSSIIPFPTSANQTPVPISPAKDREAARRFLQLLDPAAQDFTFQMFDDERSNGHEVKAGLARITSNRDEVLQLYNRGAGVYVTINETDLTGRKSENIKRIRAVWQEDDKGHGGPFPLEPSLVVESSPKHFHRYWFVSDQWPADEQGCADFAVVMERMVTSYGCDNNAKIFPAFCVCRASCIARIRRSRTWSASWRKAAAAIRAKKSCGLFRQSNENHAGIVNGTRTIATRNASQTLCASSPPMIEPFGYRLACP
jgi:hypothetical protein